MALVGAVLSSVFSMFVFQKVVKVIRLGMMLLASSVLLSIVLGPYVLALLSNKTHPSQRAGLPAKISPVYPAHE